MAIVRDIGRSDDNEKDEQNDQKCKPSSCTESSAAGRLFRVWHISAMTATAQIPTVTHSIGLLSKSGQLESNDGTVSSGSQAAYGVRYVSAGCLTGTYVQMG